MGRRFICVLLMLCLVLVGGGCGINLSKEYTFSAESGESIQIVLDSSGNYNLSTEVPFVVSQNETTLSQGTFILGDTYEQYVSIVKDDEFAELLDSGTVNGAEYIFWVYNNAEYNYAILLDGGNTGILLKNHISVESAKEVFDRLEFSVENKENLSS